MILGSFFQATGDYHSSMHAFKQARITLDGPERAGKQPESAMMIYKLGFVTFLDKKYPEAE
jgi:hypothetical protein